MHKRHDEEVRITLEKIKTAVTTAETKGSKYVSVDTGKLLDESNDTIVSVIIQNGYSLFRTGYRTYKIYWRDENIPTDAIANGDATEKTAVFDYEYDDAYSDLYEHDLDEERYESDSPPLTFSKTPAYGNTSAVATDLPKYYNTRSNYIYSPKSSSSSA
jgi:hypothetical protein